MPLPDGTWRLYVSGATPGTLHWWVEAIDAPDPASFAPDWRRPTMPGDATMAMKDPVVARFGDEGLLWVCVAMPPAEAAEADQMVTRHLPAPTGWRGSGTASPWQGVLVDGISVVLASRA